MRRESNMIARESDRLIGAIFFVGCLLSATRPLFAQTKTCPAFNPTQGQEANCTSICQASPPIATAPLTTCTNTCTLGCRCTPAQLAQLAYQHQFRCDGLVNAIAVSLAETKGDIPGVANPDLVQANVNPSNGLACTTCIGRNKSNCLTNSSFDVGLWAVNTGYHRTFPGAQDTFPPLAPDVGNQADWLFSALADGELTWGNFLASGSPTYCQALQNADPLQNACGLAAAIDPGFFSCGSQLCTLVPSGYPPTPVWTGGPSCPRPLPPCVGQGCQSIFTGASFDPNAKSGVVGYGAAGWIPNQALTYSINFSNESTATAPAQTVTVTDALNAAVLNLSTLSLGPINVGGTLVTPNSGSLAAMGTYSTALDLRPTTSLIVDITAALNSATNVLTWTFTSIDPATGQPTTNPLAGFLPPGAGGSVSFTVAPTAPATGTQITNTATVVFDANAPINTQNWINTIDNTPPVSHVSALSATSTCPAFRVSWSGSDVGSGLQGFTIYVSDSGAPYTAWLSNTTAASGDYMGAAGHAYSFYSIATDLVGNLEGAKTTAEASTSVTASGPCGAPSLSGQLSNVVQSGTTVTATLTLSNTGFTAAQAVNINQITFRTLSGSGAVTLASPTLPAAEGPLAIGASMTVPLTLNVPATVTRFSMTESGNLQDGSGKNYNYSMAQTVIP